MRTFLFLLLLLCGLRGYGQTQDTFLVQADQQQLDTANEMYTAGEDSTAEAYLIPRITERYHSGNFTIPLADSYHRVAQRRQTRQEHIGAVPYVDTALMIRRQLTETTDWQLARSYYLKGISYSEMGTPKLGLSLINRALEYGGAAFEAGETRDDIQIYYGVHLEQGAKVALENRDFSLAENRLEQLDEFLVNFPDQWTEFDGNTTRGNLARAQKKYPKAVSVFRETLASDFVKNNPWAYYLTASNLADVLSANGEYPAAERRFQEIIAAYQNYIREDDDPSTGKALGQTYANYLQHYLNQQRYDTADELLRSGIEHSTKYYHNGLGPDLGELYFRAALAHAHQGNISRADSLFDQANAALVIDFSPLGPARLPRIEGGGIFNQEYLLRALSAKRSAYLMEAEAGIRTDGYELALATSRSIDTLLGLNREQLSLTASLTRFIDQEADNYRVAVDIALGLYRRTGNDDYLEEAYRFVSGQKSKLLRRYLASTGLAEAFGVPTEFIARKEALELSVLRVENTLQFASAAETPALRDSLLRLNTLVEELRTELHEEYPAYARALRGATPVDLTAARAQLADDQLLIEYFLTQDSIYAFTLRTAGLGVTVLPRPANLETAIEQVVAGGAAAGAMFEDLVFPLLSAGIERLQFIPDGILWRLPFAALRTTADRFLIEDYSVSYAYSASLLFDPDLAASVRRTEEVYQGYGIDYGDIIQNLGTSTNRSAEAEQLRNMGSLPFATREVIEVSNIIGGRKLLNAEATKSRFLQDAARARILHVSMHGMLKDNPMESALVFRSDSGAVDYALLRMGEVLGTRFPAELTVLSACHTGNGSLQSAEGMQSLGRAFTAAGSRSTITSSWEARDETTRDILVGFYEALKEGTPRDVALRQSIRSYLENGTAADRRPRNWANLMLTGSVAPMYTGWSTWWLIVGGLLLLLLGGWWWRRRA